VLVEGVLRCCSQAVIAAAVKALPQGLGKIIQQQEEQQGGGTIVTMIALVRPHHGGFWHHGVHCLQLMVLLCGMLWPAGLLPWLALGWWVCLLLAQYCCLVSSPGGPAAAAVPESFFEQQQQQQQLSDHARMLAATAPAVLATLAAGAAGSG